MIRSAWHYLGTGVFVLLVATSIVAMPAGFAAALWTADWRWLIGTAAGAFFIWSLIR